MSRRMSGSESCPQEDAIQTMVRVRVKYSVKEMVWIRVRIRVRVNIRFMMGGNFSMRWKVRVKCQMHRQFEMGWFKISVNLWVKIKIVDMMRVR